MLVLSRKIGERIVLPEMGVRITVLEVSGKRVRIGIEAPRATAVHRAEVWQQIVEVTQPAPIENAAVPEVAYWRSSA